MTFKEDQMIELYFMPGNAPSRAVLMCFKQLNLPIELWPVDKLYENTEKLQSFQKEPQLVEKAEANPKKEEKLIKALDQLDSILEGKEFVDGGEELTIADLSIFASVTELRGVDYSVDKWPNISKWASKLERLLPYHKEVNEEPLKVFREFVKTLKA